MKMSSKLEDPDYVEFWRQQFKLEDLKEKYCLNCENYFWCGHYGRGYFYDKEMIDKKCKIKVIREVVAKIEAHKKHDLVYYVATIKEYEELKKIQDIKEKTLRYTDIFTLDDGTTAVAGRTINPKKLSVWQKIKAIAGVNETVGFCEKHKIYCHQEPFTAQMNQDIICVCPLRIKELKKRELGEKN